MLLSEIMEQPNIRVTRITKEEKESIRAKKIEERFILLEKIAKIILLIGVISLAVYFIL